MNTRLHLRAFSVLALTAAASLWTGCVASRPARNGVFNENQYLRKDFLVRPGDSTNPDRGWMLKATITNASEPNVFGDAAVFGLYPGSHNTGNLVHFVITSDKLQMVDNREINGDPSIVGREGTVINAWSAANVDLKYRVNLDGEQTNFYEENQELPWQNRQWVKVNFDKNDMQDLAPLGAYFSANIAYCADLSAASATLAPNSVFVDEAHDYAEWSVQVTLPIKWDNADCVAAFGEAGDAAQRMQREYETVTLKYSMMRATEKPSYQPMVLDEKDPIRRKYGPITYTATNRDPNTGLLAAQEFVVRYDPAKEIKWYFEKGFPDQYKNIFTRNPAILQRANQQPLPMNVPTIEDQTNAVFTQAQQGTGTATKVSFHEYDEPLDDGTPYERTFGDVRFNILRWLSSLDANNGSFAGVESGVVDPRTGEALSNDIVFANFAIKDYYVARIDAYLQTIGASSTTSDNSLWSQTPWADPTIPDPNDPTKTIPVACDKEGKTVPIVQNTLVTNHNGLSTLYQKMQGYLYRPQGTYGALGPQDFVMSHRDATGATDTDFFRAYYAYLPYIVYADPETNQFVKPEGSAANTSDSASANLWSMISQERQLHQISAAIDRGEAPFDPTTAAGEKDAQDFMNKLRALSINHRALQYAKASMQYKPGVQMPKSHMDSVSSFTLEQIIKRDARHCVSTGGSLHWETKDEWINSLITTYWSQVFWHEFGHALGLDHNFMASVDKNNFPPVVDSNGKPVLDENGQPTYKLYSSSVMEYNASPDRVFWGAGWGPYDQGAIGWIYGNPKGVADHSMTGTAGGISGQISPKAPWNDPYGFDASGTEIQYLFCDARHMAYTPLCRQGDAGTTPSEITANEIDNYEWQYKWRNFRAYRKIWDDSKYENIPLNAVTELRRFTSLWAYDMSGAEVTDTLIRIGIKPPPGVPSSPHYYDQLTEKFNDEMAHAGSISAAFHEAVIQQSAGQRPYITVYDHYFGDVTYQGITLDKLFALQSWLALWPVDNYDPTQSAGAYIASYTPFGLSSNINGTGIGSLYQTVAEQAADSMIGGAYDAFAYFKPLGVSQFTQDTHSINFVSAIAGASRTEVRDWTGGLVFTRLDDFLAYFRDLATQFNLQIPPYGVDCSTTIDKCSYDPRTPRAFAIDTNFSDGYNEFLGPDGRRYIWVYIKDRNAWVVADRDRNSATYVIMRNYTTDVIQQHDDGNYGGAAYSDEQQIKYFIDYFTQANTFSQ